MRGSWLRWCAPLTVLLACGVAGAKKSTVAIPITVGAPKPYLVELRPGALSAAGTIASSRGIQIHRVYRRAMRGFSAYLTPAQVAALQRDPSVVRVWPDRKVSLPTPVDLVISAGDVDAAAKKKAKKQKKSKQKISTGIKRIGAPKSPTAAINGKEEPMDIDVAVFDTGVDPAHPDLNVVGGFSAYPGGYGDPHGHGTHVAGIIGARDNRIGVVGVAPGARIWSARVLDADGSGSWSAVIEGCEWALENAEVIDVANFSLVSEGGDAEPIRNAFDALVAAGITVVVAAGNDGKDAGNYIPSQYESTICVSALADSNGKGGKSAGVFKNGKKKERDELLASFSNFGSVVDITAPGVLIRSTYPGGRYALMSGTSQATPHVAGAAALYLLRNPGATPAQVRAGLLANATARFKPGKDPDGVAEPVLNVKGL